MIMEILNICMSKDCKVWTVGPQNADWGDWEWMGKGYAGTDAPGICSSLGMRIPNQTEGADFINSTIPNMGLYLCPGWYKDYTRGTCSGGFWVEGCRWRSYDEETECYYVSWDRGMHGMFYWHKAEVRCIVD